MKHNKFLILGMAVSLVLFAQACKKEKHEMHGMHDGDAMMESEHHVNPTQSKGVTVGDIEFALDLMPIEAHIKMLESMKMTPMGEMKGATHGLMITMMSKKSGELVKASNIDVQFTGEKGENVSRQCESMSGHGMQHYVTQLKLEKGTWKAKAMAVVDGKKVPAETEFEIQ